MCVPSISERKHFRLVPGEAEEPTFTIVLTSQTSHYVDVRIYKEQYWKELEGRNGINSIAVVEWAFAGTSSTTQGSNGPGDTKSIHSVWEHWIDSKSDNPQPDEGNMWPQSNGDVLERGTQILPVTGLQTEYEELWGDLDVEKVGEEKERISIVLKVENQESHTRGMVVRVGDWCQGIMKSGGVLNIERWHCMKTQNTWERVVKIGSSDLPCVAACNNEMTSEKGTVVSNGLLWNVIEVFRW